MILSERKRIVTKAIREKLVIEVDYTKKNGSRSLKLMEPFDIKPDKNGEMVFWGWDLERNSISQRKIAKIKSISITEQHFDPKVRERTFSYPPKYEIPRDW